MNLLRALVVHCDDDVGTRLTGMLALCGFDAIVAKDTLGALRLASEDGIDLIVTDIDDAKLGGLELLDLVGRGVFGAHPPPVIGCVSQKDVAVSQRSSRVLCTAFLNLPLTMENLIAALDSALPVDHHDERQIA